MAMDRELREAIERLIDERIEPIRVRREEHEELKAGQRRLEDAHARVEDELARLAAAQRETQESLVRFQHEFQKQLQALAEAQAATDRSLKELAARTDRRFEEILREMRESAALSDRRFEEMIREMRESAARTDRRFEEMTREIRELSARTDRRFEALQREVGGLGDRLGSDLEEIGRIVVADYLREQEGIELASLEGRFLRVDGEEVELDIFGEGRRAGEAVLVIGECKARVFPRELEAFARRTEPLGRSSGKPLVRAVYCQRVHPDAERFARETGIILVPWSYQHRIWARGA
jgi:hypothetical protein